MGSVANVRAIDASSPATQRRLSPDKELLTHPNQSMSVTSHGMPGQGSLSMPMPPFAFGHKEMDISLEIQTVLFVRRLSPTYTLKVHVPGLLRSSEYSTLTPSKYIGTRRPVFTKERRSPNPAVNLSERSLYCSPGIHKQCLVLTVI